MCHLFHSSLQDLAKKGCLKFSMSENPITWAAPIAISE